MGPLRLHDGVDSFDYCIYWEHLHADAQGFANIAVSNSAVCCCTYRSALVTDLQTCGQNSELRRMNFITEHE